VLEAKPPKGVVKTPKTTWVKNRSTFTKKPKISFIAASWPVLRS